MNDFSVPFVRTFSSMAAAIIFGAFIAGDGGSNYDGCQLYEGYSQGNDPYRQVQMKMCRNGDKLQAVKYSEGRAGVTSYLLSGEAEGRHLTMTVQENLKMQTNNGWVSCDDDVIELRERCDGSLVGTYTSESCHDHAKMVLKPVDAFSKKRVVKRHKKRRSLKSSYSYSSFSSSYKNGQRVFSQRTEVRSGGNGGWVEMRRNNNGTKTTTSFSF